MIQKNNFSSKILRSVSEIFFKECKKCIAFDDGHINENKGWIGFELKDLFAMITGESVANSAFGIDGQGFSAIQDLSVNKRCKSNF